MRYLLLISIALCTFFYFSCTSVVKNPHTLSWYQPKPLDSLPQVSLKGKLILIDPGHGNGNASGAVGKHGTKEKDINLAVARMLRLLLENQGATIKMTRETDTTTLWPVNLPSRDDLRMRCQLRDSLLPDLFVSIHHNGSEDGSPDENGAKIFYAMEDVGGSLDAAQYINTEFSELLGLGPSQLLCGNYFVLRNPTVPAILGEPSYLSNPAMERILGNSSALEIEAMAYYRGIVKWFASGVPKITGISIDSISGAVTATISDETPLDPLITGLYLDNTRLNGKLCANGYMATLPFPLKNAPHSIKCIAANMNGNFSTPANFLFTVNRSAKTLIAAVENQPAGCYTTLRVTALDKYGFPVIDGTKIAEKSLNVASTIDGTALLYVPVEKNPQSIDITCDSITINPVVPAGTDGVAPVQGFVSSVDTCFKVPTSLISISGKSYAPDRNGFFSIDPIDTFAQVSAVFTGTGFRDTTATLQRGKINRIKLTPRRKGIFIGKKIILDPEFGGAESGGIDARGIRACDVSRKIANETAGLLEEYGADVSFARQEDHTIHETERVFAAEKSAAEIYLIIRSDSLKLFPYISFLPGSELGRNLAEKIAFRWKKISGNSTHVSEEPSFIMQQTSCPAVTLSLSPLLVKNSMVHGTSQKIAGVVLDALEDYFLENCKVRLEK